MNPIWPMRILFMGTPDFAVPTLNQLLQGPDELVMVVTQPDRPSGRGRTVTPPPVKRLAETHGVKVFQPESLKPAEVYKTMAATRPDLVIVAAFGKILGRRYLELPRLGCFNVHASLLPRWRGPAPINWAILDGDRETGVTIMKMDVGLDTGPIAKTFKTEIGPRETCGELHDRLAAAGAGLMGEVLSELRAGRPLTLTEQDPARASYATMLKKEDGLIDFSLPPERFVAHVHSMTPWPSATCFTPRGPLKICRAEVAETSQPVPTGGTIIAASPLQGLIVATGGGAVRVLACQRPGKQVLDALQYLNGVQGEPTGEHWEGRPMVELAATGPEGR